MTNNAQPTTIDCLCGDVFPSVETFHEHVHLSHPEADHPEPREPEPLRGRETMEHHVPRPSDICSICGNGLVHIDSWRDKPEARLQGGPRARTLCELTCHPTDTMTDNAQPTTEALAALEHEQWMTWAQSLMDSEPISEARRERWAALMVPYSDLSEEMKEHDRKWARRVLEIDRAESAAKVLALARVRLTGEQLDAIDPDPEKHHWVDWDEHEDFVSLADVCAALDADAPAEPHKPGEPHDYRLTCAVCGEKGTVRVSVEPERAALDADAPAETHRYDHDGTHRHHHHDQTGDPVWWLNCDQFGGERREHRHGANDTLDRLRTTIEAEVRDRTALLDTRLADLRRAALAVYHGRVGFDNPKDPDILALGAVLFPDRACGEVVHPFRASCVLPRGHDGDHRATRPVAPEPRSAEPVTYCRTCGKTRMVEWLHRECTPETSLHPYTCAHCTREWDSKHDYDAHDCTHEKCR